MKLTDFKTDDYYDMVRSPDHDLKNWIHEGAIPTTLALLEVKGRAKTLWEKNKVYAVFGVISIRLGVGDLFFIPSKDWTQKKKSICSVLRRELNQIKPEFQRLQMTCLEQYGYERFAEFFGFLKEGSLRRYDKHGRTYSMLSIIGGNL